jgi:hypothetical protein
MLLTTLPCDYATLLDGGDRVRRAGRPSHGSRVRVAPSPRRDGR